MGPRLFSGWGVRTLAEGEGRYNPIGYHVGTVWPFDNSFIAWGLRRYGFKEEAARIAAGILDAAEFFDGRLPEAFAGYERARHQVPGPVPDRLQPSGVVDRNAAAPAARRCSASSRSATPHRRPGAAAGIGHLELLDIPGRWGRVDAFGRGRVHLETPRPRRSRRSSGREDGRLSAVPQRSCLRSSAACDPRDMTRATNAQDVAAGLLATGVRAGAAAGRLALLPVRLAARAPIVGSRHCSVPERRWPPTASKPVPGAASNSRPRRTICLPRPRSSEPSTERWRAR